MGQTTFANLRGIAHKGSNGMSTVFPDVCKTPTPSGAIVPVPYPNIGKSSDTAMGPLTVTVDGQMPMTKGAVYIVSSGDEPGTAGGVLSQRFKAECEFMLYSFDIKFEGRNVCRLGDPLFHNAKNIMG
jgi:Domain of unknown function (DUF4150)